MLNSLKIAALATIVATILGTMMALALVRYQFRGRGADEPLHLPAARDARGRARASLLSLFLTIGYRDRVHDDPDRAHHVQHQLRRRDRQVALIGFDRHLEEAAQDLGANGLQTFMRVTLPLIAPGVLAAALLAFALSIDDFVITNT